MPWVVGIASTVCLDMFRFAEMFRQNGTLDGGAYIVACHASPWRGRKNWTGEKAQ